jgi:hypothetical protein
MSSPTVRSSARTPVTVPLLGLPLIDDGLAGGADLFGEQRLREPEGLSDLQ